MRVVYLSFILVHNTVDFFWIVRLLISRLCQDHDLNVLSTITTLLLQILVLFCSLPNDDTT